MLTLPPWLNAQETTTDTNSDLDMEDREGNMGPPDQQPRRPRREVGRHPRYNEDAERQVALSAANVNASLINITGRSGGLTGDREGTGDRDACREPGERRHMHTPMGGEVEPGT